MHPRAVVVAVPTYQRRRLLQRLLRSLEAELPEGVLVIIGDNDAGSDAPEVAENSPLDTVCIPVRERGISQVRNALIREATTRRPTWEALVMLDDDGYVEPGWYAALVEAVDRFGADVTAGPVLGSLPEDASLVARNSIYAGRTRHDSGPIPMLTGAQNIAVRRRLTDRLGDPWFADELGRSGAEDYHFMRRSLSLGARFAWAADAAVTEPTPPERLTTAAITRRAFDSNRVCGQVDATFTGTRTVVRRTVTDLGWTARNVAAGLAHRDVDRLVQAGMDGVCLAGRVTGLLHRRLPSGSHSGCAKHADDAYGPPITTLQRRAENAVPLKDLARSIRDEVLPRERLRRRHGHALVASTVKVMGDITLISLAQGVTVHGPTVLSVENGGGLTDSRLGIGPRTYVGEFNNIRCAGAPIRIGADCLVSQFVTLVGSNHGTVAGTPIVGQDWDGDGIVIGNDVWLGAGCVVLPGSRIGDGAVVAANAVVRGEVAPGDIVGGTPARVIGHRTEAPAPVRA